MRDRRNVDHAHAFIPVDLMYRWAGGYLVLASRTSLYSSSNSEKVLPKCYVALQGFGLSALVFALLLPSRRSLLRHQDGSRSRMFIAALPGRIPILAPT